MAIGALFGRLTARGLAQSVIQGAVARKMSANMIQRSLINMGLGYRRTNILTDVRTWLKSYEQGARMKYTTLGAKFTQERYIETEWQMKSRYETVFTAEMRDPLTGEVTTENVTVRHQHLENGILVDDRTQEKTREELQEEAEEYFEKQSPGGKEIIGQAMPTRGFFNPDL